MFPPTTQGSLRAQEAAPAGRRNIRRTKKYGLLFKAGRPVGRVRTVRVVRPAPWAAPPVRGTAAPLSDLHDHRRAHPAARAHRRDAYAAAPAAQFVDQRHEHPRAAGGDRVAE